jgi:hypothetical protein
MLRFVVSTDVSGLYIEPIFEALTLENETDSFSRNVGEYKSRLRNIPEERRLNLH